MPRNPLDFVLRIRRAAEDEAKRNLATGIAEESRAYQHAADAEAQISHEGEVAADLAGGDGVVEAYAAWLPVGRKHALEAREEHERATVNVMLARAALSVAYAASEAAANFLSRRASAAAALAEKKAQQALDEAAARPPGVTKD